MDGSSLMEELAKNEDNVAQIAEAAIRDRRLVGGVLQGVSSENFRVRYKCIRILKGISEFHPDILYDYFEFFERLLASKSSFVRRNAMDTILNLSLVDDEDYDRRQW